MTDLQAFRQVLIRYNICHDEDNGRFVVQGDVYLSSGVACALPHSLTVHGMLNITGAIVPKLPDDLVVTKDLFVYDVPIERLPENCSIGGSITLSRTRVATLPDNLCVLGDLHLQNSPITHLPEGLAVSGYLDIVGTRLTRFPASMHVGKAIYPPVGLADAAAFMQERARGSSLPPELVLPRPETHHQRLLTRARLQNFPDLLRVVLALPPGQQVRIEVVDSTPVFHAVHVENSSI